jgi:hypothetical protein
MKSLSSLRVLPTGGDPIDTGETITTIRTVIGKVPCRAAARLKAKYGTAEAPHLHGCYRVVTADNQSLVASWDMSDRTFRLCR